MHCPSCGARTKELKVHDEQPFRYSECTECSWDDYEEQYHTFRQTFETKESDDPAELDFTTDEEMTDEYDSHC